MFVHLSKSLNVFVIQAYEFPGILKFLVVAGFVAVLLVKSRTPTNYVAYSHKQPGGGDARAVSVRAHGAPRAIEARVGRPAGFTRRTETCQIASNSIILLRSDISFNVESG